MALVSSVSMLVVGILLVNPIIIVASALGAALSSYGLFAGRPSSDEAAAAENNRAQSLASV